VWNLAVEQQRWWRPGRSTPPGYCAQAAQLTQARAEHRWLQEGSQMVQQQALRTSPRPWPISLLAPLGGRTNREPQFLAT
jgi:hypothetical protein